MIALKNNAFGMVMPERSFSNEKYRWGFNGKETDNETNWQDYGFRIYYPGLAKFLSVDPLFKSYPWYTPYQFAGNKPIVAVDLDGLEEYYTSSGQLLGKFGTNNEVRVVYDSYVNAIQQTLTTPNSPEANVINEKVFNSGSAPIFKSPDDAAADWGNRYNPTSIQNNSEMQSFIPRMKIDGCTLFTYTEPVTGQMDNVKGSFSQTDNSKAYGVVHSHGSFVESFGSGNNVFSEGTEEADIDNYKRTGLTGYVATPNGSLQRYIPSLNKVDILPVDLPSDPQDPTHNVRSGEQTPAPTININNQNPQ
jgi:RHS repeat-associated protein